MVTLELKRFDAAIAQAHRYIVRHGEDAAIIDVLKVAHSHTGNIAEAVNYGQRGLELRDEEAARLPAAGQLIEPAFPPAGRNVISFSLWGTAPFYGYGAMINLVLARTIYPDWTCRFYVDATVPAPAWIFSPTTAATCGVSRTNIRASVCFNASWSDDSTVGRFLVRDCDARLPPPRRSWCGSGSIPAIRSTWCAIRCCTTN